MDTAFIKSTSEKIGVYITELRRSRKKFKDVLNGVQEVLLMWTGETYLGEEKSCEVKNAFQEFFLQVFHLANAIESWTNVFQLEKNFLKCARFQGVIYRYIGSSSPNKCGIHGVQYNDFYMSWSKEKNNTYIISKLYDPIYLICAKIEDKHYGFDVEMFENFYNKAFKKCVYIAKGNEKEVIFPTLECAVISVEEVKEKEEYNDET